MSGKEVNCRALIGFKLARIALHREQTRTQTGRDQPQPAVNRLLRVCPGTLVKLGIIRRTEPLRIDWPSPARKDSCPTQPLSPSTPGNPRRHPSYRVCTHVAQLSMEVCLTATWQWLLLPTRVQPLVLTEISRYWRWPGRLPQSMTSLP